MPSPTSIGRAAEQLAADYLERQGFRLLVRNWRNRWCEIDIVAERAGRIHVVEVKYRRNTAYGFAAEYVSRDKLLRLRRAALAWIQANRRPGPYQIDIITLEGSLESPRIEYLPEAIG